MSAVSQFVWFTILLPATIVMSFSPSSMIVSSCCGVYQSSSASFWMKACSPRRDTCSLVQNYQSAVLPAQSLSSWILSWITDGVQSWLIIVFLQTEKMIKLLHFIHFVFHFMQRSCPLPTRFSKSGHALLLEHCLNRFSGKVFDGHLIIRICFIKCSRTVLQLQSWSCTFDQEKFGRPLIRRHYMPFSSSSHVGTLRWDFIKPIRPTLVCVPSSFFPSHQAHLFAA